LVVIPMTWQYWVLVVSLIVGGGIIFFILAHVGEKILLKNQVRLSRCSRDRVGR
jgi:hypothetical protein